MTTVKGLLKGLRYISQIFDEDKDKDIQIGFPTDVKHVAHIGSDGPVASMPSWMGDFKPQENENAQVVSRGDINNNSEIGEGVGLQELLPPPEKQHKQKKTRRKSDATASQNGSPPRRNSSASVSDMQPRPSRRHRSRHGSMDSSNDSSVSRRRRGASGTADMDSSCALSDSSGNPTSKKSSTRNRKAKGSEKGEGSTKKTKGKSEKSENTSSSVHSVDKCNDNFSDKD